MNTRYELNDKLKRITQNVYFQPPSNVQLKYPCIVYRLRTINSNSANNTSYIRHKVYDITYMSRDEETSIYDEMHKTFIGVGLDNIMVMDGIYQETYSLSYKY